MCPIGLLVTNTWAIDIVSSGTDETSERRSNQEACISESDQQMASRLRPTLFVLPFPAILVG